MMIFITSWVKRPYQPIIFLILLLGLTAACTGQTPTPTPTATASPTPVIETYFTPSPSPTQRATATPTLPPLGNPGNPVTIGYILTPDQSAAIEAADDIANLIQNDTGYQIENLIYPDFQSLSSAISNGDVHLFWLAPFEYIYLNQQGAAEVVLITNHLGVYAYGVQFMTNVFSGFTSYYDPETNSSLGDPVTALQQFSGTRPCFLNPDSLAGYYVPLGLLAETSTPTLAPVFTYSYNGMVRALYIRGICDFGVSYALTGDPRTSGDLIQNFPDVQDQVVVIWQTEGIIPNTNLSASTILPANIQHRLQESFLDLPNHQEGLALLGSALNYEVEALKTIEDEFYNPLRDVIIPLELDLEAITHHNNNP